MVCFYQLRFMSSQTSYTKEKKLHLHESLTNIQTIGKG